MEDAEVDYVTLAKAGGRKDLLHYAEDLHIGNHGDPVPYPWVEWFDHVHPPAPPTSTQLPILPRNPDSLLAWPNSLNTTTKSTNKTQRRTISLPTIAQKNLISRQRQTNRQKHPKLPTVNEPINMKALLSLEYQKEWVKRNDQKIAEEKRIRKVKKQLQQEKIIEHSMKKRSINVVEKTERERFIMKRFKDIPAKVKLPPINKTGNSAIGTS